MRKFILVVLANCVLLTADCQLNYWQQQVNYTIGVSLNDKDNTLDGFEKIDYINNSPDTLRFIWFHVWPNAYKNDKTAFSDQLLKIGNTKFYFSDKEEKGYINRLDFKVNNITAETEDHPQYIDIIKVILPAPLAPSQRITITTPFHEKLPLNFSRGGHEGETYQATQWYPKPAVYDKNGWHPIPYLDQGEYYSEFGSFDVSITVPKNYVVAATGELQEEEEKEWLKTRTAFSWAPVQKKIKTKGGQVKLISQKYPPSATELKTLHFKQDRIHDFAWFADKRFIVQQDSCLLPSGKIITVSSYYTSAEKNAWQNALLYSKRATRFYSTLVGEYPYTIVSVVQGPKNDYGGMEYPTITLISPTESLSDLENTIAHEIGHNWFYGILATNERDHPWMDEGLNTYYDNSYNKYYKLHQSNLFKVLLATAADEKLDQPIETKAADFSDLNYATIAYVKTGEWMQYLRSRLGTDTFNTAMQEYYRRWQFKHPQPEDFKQAIEQSSGRNLDTEFSYLNKKGILPAEKQKGSRVVSFLQPEHFGNRWSNSIRSTKNIYWIGPAIGSNAYDKFMIGALITNFKLPLPRLQFLVAPMYSTGAKKLVGLGLVNYSFYPDGFFRKVDIGVSGSRFSSNEFKKEDGKKIYYGFEKLVPRIRLTLGEKDPRSTLLRYVQWKSYFLKEGAYRVRYDSIITPTDTTIHQVVKIVDESRMLNQLKVVIENSRALYPYKGELNIEQSKDFVRITFTGNYFFNYAKGGGLDVRFFAGKFLYPGSKTSNKFFDTDRYHLNLTGSNGYEDYTYSDYFAGRNKFEGFASQQIMIKDGGFKVRTDLLSDKVGKTDDWLIAANFSSTIPPGINPLNLLPVKIPLKLFVDIGTHAEAWDRNSNEDRFLFDAGIHVPLLKETVNFYIPLLYSRVFKDYKNSYLPKKNRFAKMISFSIDISNLNLRKFDRHIFF